MPTEEIDLVDEILGPTEAARREASKDGADAQSKLPEESESAAIATTPDEVEPKGPVRFRMPAFGMPAFRMPAFRMPAFRMPRRNPLAGIRFGRRSRRALGVALAFTAGALAGFALLAAVVMLIVSANANRVVPGVHVGAVDLTGLTRDQVIARLNSTYGYLGQGQVTVSTPAGQAAITYQRLGRALDVDFVTDQVMAIGHSGDAIGDAAVIARTAVIRRDVPAVVSLDPTAVALSLRQLAGQNLLPWDAQAWVRGGAFGFAESNSGVGIDEPALADAIIAHLTEPDAPADFQAGGAFVNLKPRVSDKDAQAAIAMAQRMVVGINLEVALPEIPASGSSASGSSASGSSASSVPASGAAASGRTATPPKSFTIPADMVVGWIVFGTRSDGTYGPSADPALMNTYLSGLSQQLRIAPVESTIVVDHSGAAPSIQGGRDGADIDVQATASTIALYLDGLAAGESRSSMIAARTTPVTPTITAEKMSRLVNIGSWTTTFYPDVSNGNGANIRVPATLINGQIVAPGQQFSFLSSVSPVDQAHGYTWGGVIKGGKSEHTGAMGGGICSASTTVFNAAARAGLQIDERHAHYYYIDRYPIGLDATVYSNGADQVWDMKWTNDTPNPIVIVAGATYGTTSKITVQLWSLPIGRTANFTPEFKANVVKAGDYVQYTNKLAPGQWGRAEFPTDGFDTVRTRTVTNAAGTVIHTETWYSHYTKVDGLKLIGGSAPVAPTPPPGPTPTAVVLLPFAVAARIRKSRKTS